MAGVATQDTTGTFNPPRAAPPFLSPSATSHLCHQGWVRISLPAHLASCLQQLQSHTSAFFDRPDEHKQRLYPAKRGTELGYYHIAGEKSYLTLRCHKTLPSSSRSSQAPLTPTPTLPQQQTPAHSKSNTLRHSPKDNANKTDLESTAASFWTLTTALLTRILHDISRHHLPHLPLSVWDDLLAGTSAMPASETKIRSGTLLRLFRYEPRGGEAGEHTDLGLLTLCIGGRGLECFDWVGERYLDVLDVRLGESEGGSEGGSCGLANARAAGSEYGAVVLVGQTLRGLTGGRLSAGVHRVVRTDVGRESVVFALRHAWEKGDIDLGAWGGVGTVKARDLYKWLGIGVVNVNADAEVRERQSCLLQQMVEREGGHLLREDFQEQIE